MIFGPSTCTGQTHYVAWWRGFYLYVVKDVAGLPFFLPPKSGGAASNLACAMANNSVVSHVARPFTWRHVRGHFSSVRWEIGKNRSVTRVAPRFRSIRAGRLGVVPSGVGLAVVLCDLRLVCVIALRSVR